MVSTTLTTIAAGQLTSSSNHNQSSVTLASSTTNNSNYQRSTQHQQQQQQQQLQHHLSSSTAIGAATPISSHTAATTTRNNYYYDLTPTTLNGELGSNSDTKTFSTTYKTAATSSVGGAVEINHNQKHNHNLNPNPQQYKRPNSLYNGKATAAQPNDYGSNNSSSHAVNHPAAVVGETTKPDLLTSNIKSPQNDVINTTTTTSGTTTTTPTINLTKSLLSASPPLTDQISLLFPKCRPKQPTAIASNNIQSSNAISNGSDAIDVIGAKRASFNGINNSPTDIVEFNATAETLSPTKTETEHSEKTSRPRSSGSYYKTVNIITQSPPPPSTSSISSESLSSVTPRISTNPFLCPTLLTTSSINSDTPLTTVASHNLNEVDDDEDDGGDDENIDEELPVPAYPTFYYHTSSNHYNSNSNSDQRQREAEIEGRKFYTSTNSYDMPRKARSSFSSYQQQQQHQQAAAIQRQQYTKLSQATMTQQQQQQQQHIGNHHPQQQQQQQLHNGTATGSDSGTSMQQQHQHHLVNNQSQNQSQNPFIKSNYWETRQSVTTAAANAVLNSPEYGGNEIDLPSAVAAPPLASSRRAYHQQSYNSQTHHYMLRQQHHIRVGRSPVNHSEQQTQQQQLETTSKRIGIDHQLNKPQPQQQHHHQNADINHYSQAYGNGGSNNSKTSIEQHVAVMDREQYERREREGRERDREQREHRLNVAAAVVERDRERDNERERIRETAGICDVGPLQQSSGNKPQQQQQQTYKQHMSHQKNIGINNEGRLSVIADGEVVVFDDIAESWQSEFPLTHCGYAHICTCEFSAK